MSQTSCRYYFFKGINFYIVITTGYKMGYDLKKQKKAWRHWKSREEKIMRELNVNENTIKLIRDYDKKMLNQERRFLRRQDITQDSFFEAIPSFDKKEINSIDDLLNSIENEALFEILNETDQTSLKIVYLKMIGYSVKEISELLDMNISTIYYRIHMLRAKIKNNLKIF